MTQVDNFNFIWHELKKWQKKSVPEKSFLCSCSQCLILTLRVTCYFIVFSVKNLILRKIHINVFMNFYYVVVMSKTKKNCQIVAGIFFNFFTFQQFELTLFLMLLCISSRSLFRPESRSMHQNWLKTNYI